MFFSLSTLLLIQFAQLYVAHIEKSINSQIRDVTRQFYCLTGRIYENPSRINFLAENIYRYDKMLPLIIIRQLILTFSCWNGS